MPPRLPSPAPPEQSNNKQRSGSCCERNPCNSPAALQETALWAASGEHLDPWECCTYFHGRRVAGQEMHLTGEPRALSKAQLCAGAGQSRGLLENRLLSSLPNRIWVKRSLFQGQPARAGPWLTLTRAGISLLQTSNTSHPLGETRLELRVCGPCLAPWCWEGAESPPRSQTPPRRGWGLWQPRVPAGERQGVP